MSFPRYPAYKPSGVEWLGVVPMHWDEKPLKTVASINDEVLPETLPPENEIEYVDIGSVSLMNGIEKTETLLFAEAPSRARRIPRDGDVLVSTVRTYLKAIAPVISPQSNLVASTGFAVVRPRTDLHPGYLKYALQEEHFVQQVISRSTGVSYPAINASDVAKISLCLPDSAEQIAIATCLDRETAKIDALIAEQQRLIELLQEKRQVVISHAVTKGLNPNAPMKDSGVEWLGEVPEHWGVVQVRRITRAHKQGFYSSEGYIEHGVNLLRITDIKSDGSIDTLESPKVDEDSVPKEFLLEEGDFVFARTGGAGSYGFVGELDSPTAFASYLIRFRFADSIELGFLRLYFLSQCFIEGIASSIHGGVNQNVHAEDIKNQWLAIPPRDEQRAIALQVFSELDRYVALGSSIEDEMRLLNERRSALISAAVTGQIDVRGLLQEEGSEQ